MVEFVNTLVQTPEKSQLTARSSLNSGVDPNSAVYSDPQPWRWYRIPDLVLGVIDALLERHRLAGREHAA